MAEIKRKKNNKRGRNAQLHGKCSGEKVRNISGHNGPKSPMGFWGIIIQIITN